MKLHGIGRRITSAGLMREELSSASDIIRNMDWAKGAGQAREAAHGLSNRLGILDARVPKESSGQVQRESVPDPREELMEACNYPNWGGVGGGFWKCGQTEQRQGEEEQPVTHGPIF